MYRAIPEAIKEFIDQNLTHDETEAILKQFKERCVANHQVLWTGMARERAQCWADSHGLQTLTTAMGPFMDRSSPLCSKHKKSAAAWTKYIHGASAIFALYISEGDAVIILSNPPPQRFHPSGKTSFQTIEVPIITGRLGNRAVGTVNVVHPSVPAAIDVHYQLWPTDEVWRWTKSFGQGHGPARWRPVKKGGTLSPLGSIDGRFNCGKAANCINVAQTSQNKQDNTSTEMRAISEVDLKSRHKKAARALANEEIQKLRSFERKKKHERMGLQQEEMKAMKTLRGKENKIARQSTIQRFRSLREQLALKHRAERNGIEAGMALKLKILKEQHIVARKFQREQTRRKLVRREKQNDDMARKLRRIRNTTVFNRLKQCILSPLSENYINGLGDRGEYLTTSGPRILGTLKRFGWLLYDFCAFWLQELTSRHAQTHL